MSYRNKKSELYHKEYRRRNRKILREKNRKYIKDNPWITVYYNANQRCNNINHPDYKNYGNKGIQMNLTVQEIKDLWFRDKAYNLNWASIDRINSEGNYEYENCRFIEMSENSYRMNKERNMFSIFQYDLDDNFIKEWNSQAKASKKLKIDQGNISRCVNGKTKTAGGFIWKKVKNII